MARILVVDDSIVMRRNLQTILTEGGHEIVGQAINGKQAVVFYSDLQPDLVTMDITMPIMSGVDAVSHIINKDPKA
jgi:two-component system chemotaxis response regulator CheY